MVIVIQTVSGWYSGRAVFWFCIEVLVFNEGWLGGGL